MFVLAAGLVQTGAPTAEAAFEYEETSVGLEMTPVAIATDVTIQLNGKPVASFGSDSAGESILLPTGPRDTITVISADERRSVLAQKQIEGGSQIGDFIAYYTFDTRDGELRDRSGNGNDGTAQGDPSRSGSSFIFNGTPDSVEVTDISSPVDVSEFTIAATYRTDDAAINRKSSGTKVATTTDCSSWNPVRTPRSTRAAETTGTSRCSTSTGRGAARPVRSSGAHSGPAHSTPSSVHTTARPTRCTSTAPAGER